MKILITSGGTTEKIDQVRAITNHSSGRLGKAIAETFLKHGHDICLVTTSAAEKPTSHPKLSIVLISNAQELADKLESLVPEYDCIIHAMAVADYTPLYMTSLDEVEQTHPVSQLLENRNTEAKISSDKDVQVLFLKRTPKIISSVKKCNPNIKLIGFKLLVGVSKEELLKVARQSLLKNKADYILANDLLDINSSQHKAYLVSAQDVFQAGTKEEIAHLIYEKAVQND